MNLRRVWLLTITGTGLVLSAQSLPQIAVLKTLLANGLDPTVEPLLTGKIEESYVRSGRYQVLDRANIEQILKEKEFQLSSGLVSNEDAQRTGDYLGADLVVVANASRIGQLFALSAKVIDVATGVIAAHSSAEKAGKIEVLLELARQVGAELAGVEPEQQTKVASGTVQPEQRPAVRRHSILLEGGGNDNGPWLGASYFYRFSDFLAATACFSYDLFNGGFLVTAGISANAARWLDLGMRAGYGHYYDSYFDLSANGLVLNPLVLFRFGKLALGIQVAYFLKTAFIGGVGLGMSF
jgi:hypothetical protein